MKTQTFEIKKMETKDAFEFCKWNQEVMSYGAEKVYCEISEDDYWYFLEILPPYKMVGTAFLMSEFNTGDKTNGFVKFKNKYFAFVCCVQDFESMVLAIYEKEIGGVTWGKL